MDNGGIMEERLVRRRQEELLSKARLRVHRFAGALASGGLDGMGRIDDDKVSEIESQGFDIEKVQLYIDGLELDNRYEDAAMLRGAFNDLLSRASDTPEEPLS